MKDGSFELKRILPQGTIWQVAHFLKPRTDQDSPAEPILAACLEEIATQASETDITARLRYQAALRLLANAAQALADYDAFAQHQPPQETEP